MHVEIYIYSKSTLSHMKFEQKPKMLLNTSLQQLIDVESDVGIIDFLAEC